MVKKTFTFDASTSDRLEETALRLNKPQSWVVREAVVEYSARIGRLSDAERRRLLDVFDQALSRIPKRPSGAADAEMREIRRERHAGGRSPRRKRS